MHGCSVCPFGNEKCGQLNGKEDIEVVSQREPLLCESLTLNATWNQVICVYRAGGFYIKDGKIIDCYPQKDGLHRDLINAISEEFAKQKFGKIFIMTCEVNLIIEMIFDNSLVETIVTPNEVLYTIKEGANIDKYIQKYGLPVEDIPELLSNAVNEYYRLTSNKIWMKNNLCQVLEDYVKYGFINSFNSEPE